jgi:hypothetical protein
MFKPKPYNYYAVFGLSTAWTILAIGIAVWSTSDIIVNWERNQNPRFNLLLFASPAFISFLAWWDAFRLRRLQSVAVASKPLWVLVAIALLFMAINAWQMLSQLHYVRNAIGTLPEPAMYSCSIGKDENTDSAILAQWRGVRIFKNPDVGTQFLLADGQVINPTRFNAETGSFGGSSGFRWTDKGGVEKAAVLSYSDIVSERGTYEIWAGIGNWKGLPQYLNDDTDVDNWTEVSLYCTLDDSE